MGLPRHYESDLLIAYLHAYLLMLNTAKELVYSSLRTSSMREIPRSYAHWPIVLPSLNVSAGTSLLWCTPSLLIIFCTLMTPTFITSDPTSPLNSRLLYPIASSTFNLDAQLTSQTLYVENQT